MKIIHIQVNRVHVPLKTAPVDPIHCKKDGYVPTEGLHKHIIQIHTDNGYTGIGETWKGTPDSAVISAAKHLLGQDPFAIPLMRLSLPHNPKVVNSRDLGEMVPVRPINHNPSIHAFEIALADIKGQSCGLTIAQLLGGPVRENILVHYWAPRLPPKEVGEIAQEGQGLGFNGIKLKVTYDDPVIETVKTIGEKCGPDFRITLDPNQRFYTIEKTLALGAALSGYPIEVIEDPIPKTDFNDYVQLRHSLGFPLALHLERPDDVIKAIRCGAADVFNLRGTLWDVSRLGYLAEIAGLRIWRGSGLDLGILDASYTHVCAATPSCILGSDIVGQFMREDDLISDGLVYQDGHVKLPKGPGLGVTLDKDALTHFTVRNPQNKKPCSWNFD